MLVRRRVGLDRHAVSGFAPGCDHKAAGARADVGRAASAGKLLRLTLFPVEDLDAGLAGPGADHRGVVERDVVAHQRDVADAEAVAAGPRALLLLVPLVLGARFGAQD